MIRPIFALLSTGLLLGGCLAGPYPVGGGYAPPPAPPPAYPETYAPQAYAPPNAYDPGPPPGQPYTGPDGLTYVDGTPVDTSEGAAVPLVFVPALGWGFYDGEHRWRGARPDLRDRLDRFHPGGRGLPPPGAVRSGDRPGFGGPPGRPFYGAPAGRPGVPGPPGRPNFEAGRPPPGGPIRPAGGPPPERRPPPVGRGCGPGQAGC